MAFKDTEIIDLNLFSGSSELLRQAVGGFYYDSGTGRIEFQAPDLNTPVQILSTETSETPDTNTDFILPKIKYATRIYVDEANADIVSDEDWKMFIIGGTYGNKQYAGIYNENVYADHYNTSPLPLMPRQLVNTSEQPSLTLTTEYYNYYPRYQRQVQTLDKDLMTPNYYLFSNDLLEMVEDTNSCVERFSYPKLANFLTNSYVNSEKQYNPKLENIFIPKVSPLNVFNSVKSSDSFTYFIDSDLRRKYSLMPFGNKLTISREIADNNRNVAESYQQIINDNDYEIKFLKMLKETFQAESGLQTTTVNFGVNTEANVSTGTAIRQIESTTTVPVKVVDVPTMLLYAYNNPTSETNNITVISGSEDYSKEIDYVMDTTGIYRYENTENTLSVFNSFAEQMKNKFVQESAYPLENLISQANVPKFYETVAFRIEKIGGGPTGDSNTENTIQNIWFYNRGTAINYLDTQVKYNTEYTYKIYKYDLVQGYKYQMSDIATTRQIAVTSSGENQVYCLEFYDPLSGQTVDSLLGSSSLGDITDRKTMLEDKISEINIFLDVMADQKDVMDDIKTVLLEHIVEMTTGGIPYDSTILKSDFINPILSNHPDFEAYFIKASEPDFPIELPYLEREITLNSAEFPDLGTFTFSVISEIGNDAVSRVDRDFNRLKLQKVDSVTDTHSLRRYISNDLIDRLSGSIGTLNDLKSELQTEIDEIDQLLGFVGDQSTTSLSRANSSYPYLADFNVTVEPSLKIIEIPLEQKRMRIVDHPPNDLVITPHHLLDQSNRLAFYCKYDTFSMNTVTYPTPLSARDTDNRLSYLIGNDFLSISEMTQESVSSARYIEVYRTTTKPTRYIDFQGNLHKTIDLRQTNGDIPTDHIFVERVRENTKYYYVFRALNENNVAGQLSPVFEAELINDGGYVYGKFTQYSEEDLAVPPPKEPIISFKKLFNIIPNIRHLQLDTSAVNFASSSVSQISQVALGTSAEDDLWNESKYYKIRLTSKKTGKKIDLNIGFKKEERN